MRRLLLLIVAGVASPLRAQMHMQHPMEMLPGSLGIPETRMGSGKGSPEWWVANVKPGRVMFELSGVAEPVAREALRRAIHKLPMKCRVVKREMGEA